MDMNNILHSIKRLCILGCLCIALPLTALAQNQSITLSARNMPLEQAMRAICQQAKMNVAYSKEFIDTKTPVNINVKNTKLKKALGQMLKGTNIGYSFQGNSILLYQKNEPKASTEATTSTTHSNGDNSIYVSGRVTDKNTGEPIIGATVIETGTTVGTSTNIDGEYSLRVAPGSSLRISYIGYDNVHKSVGRGGTVNVAMSQNAKVLNDIVVVGYGTQKKINLTGSVQNVSSEELMRRNASNTSTALQGIIPGLSAVQYSGQPGNDNAAIKIRGLGSLNSSTAPLVLIDGVEGDMNRIDLNTVESVSVLKDAASASIYGSRASNGVILITTKRGREGKVKVNFNGYVGFNTATTLPEPATAIEYMQAVDVARANNNVDPLYTQTIELYKNGGVDNINYYDTDWRNEVIKDRAYMQNYSVNLSGGNETVKLFASAGYYTQDGLIDNNNFSRTTLRLNTDTKVNNWVRIGLDMNVRQAVAKSPVLAAASDIIGYALTMTPIMSGINADGTWGYGINGTNPIAMVRCGDNSKSTAPEYSARPTITITPLKGLTIFGAYSWKRLTGETSAFETPYKVYENGVSKGEFPTYGSSGSEQSYTTVNKQYNLQATYENTFGKNYLKALLGFQSEDMNYKYIYASRKNYYYEGYTDLVNGDISTATNSSARYSWALLSYFFRLNYSWNERYLLEVNGRYDGTSRFKKGNRWGFFPSVSAGWRISEEPFFEPLKDAINNLKLRASYGELGNQAISGYYPYASSVSGASGYGYWFDKTLSSGAAQTQLANEKITWEKSKQLDFGVDASFLGTRLTFGGDYYIRKITNMLQQFPVPLFVGMTAPWTNAGDMRNNGWELSIGWQDKIGDFSYRVKGILSDVKNKVLDLYGKEYVGSTTITKEGEQYGSWYGYVADGYFQNQQEIDDAKCVYGGNKSNIKPGYIKYVDVDGNGTINSDDRVILGNPSPRYEYSLNLSCEYKGFDFSAFFQGVGKKDVYYSGAGARALCGNYTIYKYQMDYWTPENPNAKFPILLEDPNGTNPNNMISSFWVKSGAYCRLKNIVLGYTLPKALTQKAMISNLRIYISAQNIFTISNKFYKGFDPENSIGSGASMYPLNKTFLLGVNLEF